ncbi:hypothetical protein IWW48_003771 [Coemansia sp. RSA 1200]|nr:hypothetical protein IWW48_003771 [Coemansia sp. RSA 1200]
MAFFYKQGNIADRNGPLSEKTTTAALGDYPQTANTDTDFRIQPRHKKHLDSNDTTTEDHANNHHSHAQDIATTTSSNGNGNGSGSGRRRRDRKFGDTLRTAKQGVVKRETSRLAKIFGEPNISDSADHASSTAATATTLEPTATKHGASARQRGDHHILTSEAIESGLQSKELLLNSAGRVSYGTWKGLIMYLASDKHHKTAEFIDVFMLSFRSFATPKDFAEALVARARNVAHADTSLSPSDAKLWHHRVQAPVQYNVFRIIQNWYNNYWYPPVDNAMLNYLCAFLLNDYLPTRHGSSAKECQKLLRQVSSKNRAIDLRALAASPAMPLMPLGLARLSTNRSLVAEGWADNSNNASPSRLASTSKKRSRLDRSTGPEARNLKLQNYTTSEERSGQGSGGESRSCASGNLSENSPAVTNGSNCIRDSNQQQKNQRLKRTNILRRMFSKQRNEKNISHNGGGSSSQNPPTDANNIVDRTASTELTETKEHSVNSDTYSGDYQAYRRPPSSTRSGPLTDNKLPSAKEKALAEIANQPASNSGKDSWPATTTATAAGTGKRISGSSSEEPDISDLLMATVGMDLSYEAYRKTPHITHINPLDVACQLTIIESSCYCMIQPAELINKEFSRGSDSRSVNVRQMSRWCTQITRWISVLILSESTPDRRCRMLKYAIQLGIHLLALKNYDGVMAIRAAIFSAAVMRLKRSWAILPKKFNIMSKRLHEALDSDHNYANYRSVLHRSQPPLLPFLGLYLTDLTFLDDGNPTYRRLVLPQENTQPQNCYISNQASQESGGSGNDNYCLNDSHDTTDEYNHYLYANESDNSNNNSNNNSSTGNPQVCHGRQQNNEEARVAVGTTSAAAAGNTNTSDNGVEKKHQQQPSPPQMPSTVTLTGQTCALFAKRNEVDLNNRSTLINFEKSNRIASIIQEIQKFQVEYSGNFTMVIPGLQQFLIEQWDQCEAEGYDDERIYSMSLQCEPRAQCHPLNTGGNAIDDNYTRNNNSSSSYSNNNNRPMIHHQPVQTAMRFSRFIPNAAQRLRGKDNSDPALSKLYDDRSSVSTG